MRGFLALVSVAVVACGGSAGGTRSPDASGDVLADSAACGAAFEACCDNLSCAVNLACHDGQCLPRSDAAADARIADGSHDTTVPCGALGQTCCPSDACDTSLACKGGVCACPPLFSDCAGTCVETGGTDLHNCGGCGKTCPSGAYCAAGTCSCPGDDIVCGGVCVDSSTDDSNCGGCGVTCGATCAYGRCVSTVTTVEPDEVYSLAADGTNVYWLGTQSLYSAPVTGGTATTLGTASGVGGTPGTLAIDATHAYWTGVALPNDGAVYATPLAGGTTITVATSGDEGLGIAIDDTTVYWLSSNVNVLSVPKLGGAVNTLATTPSVNYAVAVDSTNLYWADGVSLLTMPKGGGTVTTIVAAGANYQYLTLGGSDLVWAGDNRGGIVSPDIEGGAPETLTTDLNWAPFVGPQQVASDGTSVYAEAPDGLIKISMATGSVTYLSRETPPERCNLAIDATSVYWVTNDAIQRVTPR
jgi:hypothetical protein